MRLQQSYEEQLDSVNKEIEGQLKMEEEQELQQQIVEQFSEDYLRGQRRVFCPTLVYPSERDKMEEEVPGRTYLIPATPESETLELDLDKPFKVSPNSQFSPYGST